ncbi:MAG: EAL domain-containing protein, partial [Gammaproteobacteria bacterium]|nr:EAL domain-containing protein [Gammaproteobacteria bacterium]
VAINNAKMVAQQHEKQEVLQQSEDRFVVSQSFANIGTWDWNIETGALHWSAQIAPLLGYAEGELESTYENFIATIHDDDRQAVIDAIKACIKTGADYEIEHRVVWPDGTIHHLLERGKTSRDKSGKATHMRGATQDITERKKAEEQHRLAVMLLDNTHEGVMITDTAFKVLSVNPALTRTTGFSAEELQGKPINKFSAKHHDAAFYKKMWQRARENGHWKGEIWNCRKNGEIYPEWLNLSEIKDESGKVVNYAFIFSDVTTQGKVRKQLHSLTYYDTLTELPNRTLFHDRLKNALAQSRRHRLHVAVMFLDIDRFKNINDTLGHGVGDELLKKVAEQLQYYLRDMGSVSRLGGDEFAIIMPDISSPKDAAAVAEKIIKSFASPMTMNDGHKLFTSLSIGISLCPEDGDEADLLIKNAETAMYRAKASGRGDYLFYATEMSADFAERLTIETDLHQAIMENQLTLTYQPQIDLITGRLIGFEAVACWDHPEHGLISPALFISIAEDSGQIERLSEWVLNRACQQLKIWQGMHGNNWRMAVKLSSRQLHKHNVTEQITAIVRSADVLSDMMEFELSESAMCTMMDNIENYIQTIDQLSSHGFHITLDNFGSSYSSLSYLRRFKIDRLKIDQSFVREVTTSEDDAEIVTTIIAMAHNLGLRVIAEGVESKEQLEFLRTKGCDVAQGLFISQARSAEEIDRLLASGELQF